MVGMTLQEFTALENWIEAKITDVVNERLGAERFEDSVRLNELRHDLFKQLQIE